MLTSLQIVSVNKRVAVTNSMIGEAAKNTTKYICLSDLPADETGILKGYFKTKVLEVAETNH